MRTPLLLCALTLVACAKSEQKAADTQAAAPAAATPTPQGTTNITAADVAGTWTGTAKLMTKDTVVVNIEQTMTSTTEGWTLKLPNGTHPVRVVTIGGDSVITESGPFPSAVRKGKQVQLIRNVMHLKDGKLTGVTHATYVGGDTTSYRLEMSKKGA
jgi:hypothetical protein